MSRCGCSDAVCRCLLQGCDDGSVTVTGSGYGDDPYVICSNVALEVTDTDTVDLTLDGDGSGDDPWTVSADVIINPDSGDLLVSTPDGLLVSCDAVQRCVGLAVAEGQGLEYVENNIDDPVSGDGALSVCISTDNNNVLMFGSDGCLHVPAGDPAACITSLSPDCLPTTVTAGGECTIALVVDPDPCNGLVCGPDGLFAARFDNYQGFSSVDGVNGARIPAGTVIGPGEEECAGITTLDITAPVCGDLAIHLQFGVTLSGFGPGSAPIIGYRRDLGGGAMSGTINIEGGIRQDGSNSIIYDVERDFFNFVVPAGTTLTIRVQQCVRNDGTAPFTIDGNAGNTSTIRYWGNLQPTGFVAP